MKNILRYDHRLPTSRSDPLFPPLHADSFVISDEVVSDISDEVVGGAGSDKAPATQLVAEVPV